MTVAGSLARPVAVTLLTATGVALPATTPTVAAEGCRPGHGVTVVVDFHQLHHADVRSCLPDGGGQDAARLLQEAGLSLADVQRQPGFVCRVDGLPADDPCVNTPPSDAYWSLWWSDGTSGEWTYATVGASALEVPDGGFVGMVWDRSAGDLRPSLRPAAGHRPLPTPAAAQGGRSAASDAAGDDGSRGGLPTWVPPAAVGLLLAGAAGTAVARRRRGGPS